MLTETNKQTNKQTNTQHEWNSIFSNFKKYISNDSALPNITVNNIVVQVKYAYVTEVKCPLYASESLCISHSPVAFYNTFDYNYYEQTLTAHSHY